MFPLRSGGSCWCRYLVWRILLILLLVFDNTADVDVEGTACLSDYWIQHQRCWFLFFILCSGLKSSLIKRWRRCCRHLRAVRAADWKIQRGKNGNIDKRNLRKKFKPIFPLFKEIQTFSIPICLVTMTMTTVKSRIIEKPNAWYLLTLMDSGQHL